MIRVAIVTGSTRPGRNNEAAACWVHDIASKRSDAEFELVDIASYNLPLLDEAVPPSMGEYSNAHTKAWAEKIASFDAYVFVTPEYNYCPPPGFGNALNYLYNEWNYKACGFVSYGGVSGGLRAAQLEKQLVTTLKMMPMVEGVMVPMVSQQIGSDGTFASNELIDASAQTMLDELWRWADGLKAMRECMGAAK
jgi:NAD(P)H-dependent FMN reductase